MTERRVNVGNQRLILGQNLGDEFVRDVESDPSDSDSVAVKTARSRLLNNPYTLLVGYKIKSREGFKEIEGSLVRQMGLPPGSGLKEVSDRLVGREADSLLVIIGLEQVPLKERERIKNVLKKRVKVESIFEK
ncbi:hypothetical protein HYS82_01830 [Candidatus Amesbacteria bacterium]|nr:hypothetical protein [Candidatus Amesbacteria bacterium]